MNNAVTDDDAVNVALLPSFVEIELIKFAFLVPACASKLLHAGISDTKDRGAHT